MVNEIEVESAELEIDVEVPEEILVVVKSAPLTLDLEVED